MFLGVGLCYVKGWDVVYVCVCVSLSGSQMPFRISGSKSTENVGISGFSSPVAARLLCLILVWVKWIVGEKRKGGKRNTLTLSHLLSGTKLSSFLCVVPF